MLYPRHSSFGGEEEEGNGAHWPLLCRRIPGEVRWLPAWLPALFLLLLVKNSNGTCRASFFCGGGSSRPRPLHYHVFYLLCCTLLRASPVSRLARPFSPRGSWTQLMEPLGPSSSSSLVGSHWQFCGFTCTHTHTWAIHTEEPHLSYRGTHTHTHMCNTYMERWSVPPSGYGSSSSHRATEKKKNRVRSRLSFFFFFSILLIPSAIAAAAGGGGVELLLFFSQPAKDRSFASVRSFIHFIFLLFPSFQFSCVFFWRPLKTCTTTRRHGKRKEKKGLIAFTHRVMGAPSLFFSW